MRRLQISCVVLIASAGAVVAAQNAAGLAPLQGRWVVTFGEHNGKPLDAIKGGVMTITGDAFEVRTASGNVLTGTLRVNPAKTPAEMDMLHADGERWDAIYEVSGDTLRINYVDGRGKDSRPRSFETSAATEESLVNMRRESR